MREDEFRKEIRLMNVLCVECFYPFDPIFIEDPKEHKCICGILLPSGTMLCKECASKYGLCHRCGAPLDSEKEVCSDEFYSSDSDWFTSSGIGHS